MALVAGILFLFALAISLLGVRIFRRGWIGKRVGENPYCRRCGFDLHGRSLSGRCPECGADLEARRDVVLGIRHHGWGRIVAGVLVLAIGIAPLTMVGWGQLNHVNWQQHKPVFWLVHEARMSDRTTQTPALAELLRRMQAGTLTSAQVTRIFDVGLQLQRDRTIEWNTDWGDWIEAARGAGRVSDEQWKKYAEQAIGGEWLTLAGRLKMHRGDTVKLLLNSKNARVGQKLKLYAQIQELGMVLDEKEYPNSVTHDDKGMSLTALGQGSINANADPLNDALLTLPVGPHKGYARVQVTVSEGMHVAASSGPGSAMAYGYPNARIRSGIVMSPMPQMPMPTLSPPPATNDPAVIQAWVNARRAAIRTWANAQRAMLGTPSAPIYSVPGSPPPPPSNGSTFVAGKPTGADLELHIPIKFDVVDDNVSIGTPIKDDSLLPAMQRALGVYMVSLADTAVQVQVQCDDLPIDVSYNVFLREGEREWKVGGFAAAAHGGSSVQSVVGVLPPGDGPSDTTVDVVFRPDGGSAGLMEDRERYWNSPVTVHGVYVNDPYRQYRDRRTADALVLPAIRHQIDDADSVSANPAAPAAAPASAHLTPAPDLGAPMTQLKKMQDDLRDRLIEVPGDDLDHYRDFLTLPGAGLIKLLPRGKYEDSMIGIPGGGAYYSFVRKTHEFGDGCDLELNEDSRFIVGLTGNDYGYFLPLGDVPIEQLAAATVAAAGSAPPPWVKDSIAGGWNVMWRRGPLSAEVVLTADMRVQQAAKRKDYKFGMSSEPGRTYLLRSVAGSAGMDTLIGFRVLRKFDDGSVVLAYRILKRFESPSAPTLTPRRLPTTRVP